MNIFKRIFINTFLLLSKVISKENIMLMEDYFFLYVPIWLIRKLTISTDGYFKYFTPKKGDIIFDIGAYNGNFSIILSRLVGKEGMVYAFEPQKEMYVYINNRIKKYSIKNIVPINRGVFSHKTRIAVQKETPNEGFSIENRDTEGEENSEIIDLIDIDSFVKENWIKNINFLKMDIEGAEIEALEGARESLKIFSPQLVVASYHLRDGEKTSKWVENFLEEQGYKTWTGFPSHLTTYGRKLLI
jgi:FkbM family methyltransferase